MFLTGIISLALAFVMFVSACKTDDDGGGGGGGSANVPAVTLVTDNAKLLVSWTAVSDAVAYQVVWGAGLENPPDPLTGANSVDNISGTSHTIRALGNGTSYSIWVRGKKADSTYTGYSEKKTATPIASDAPPAKPIVTVTPTDDGELEISWTDAQWSTSYDVRVGVQNDLTAATLVAQGINPNPPEATTGTGNIQGVPGGGPLYYVWVTAKNVTSGGTTQTNHSDSKQVTIIEAPANEAALLNTTWRSLAGVTFTFNANNALVYTPTGAGAAAQDGTYTYANPPTLVLTLGGGAAAVNATVKGKTFTYNNARYIKQ